MEQVSSRVVYRNAWMTVREDEVRRADGSTGLYGVVDKPDFALVVPRERGGCWLVEQYRYPAGRRALEFPQGSWTAGGAGTPAELARAELREETGLVAAELEHVGHLRTAYGFCSQGFDVWLATGLTAGRVDRELSEQDMTSRWVSDVEMADLVRNGEIVDAASLAAWSLLLLHEAAAVAFGR
jgi:8-oxo-dGTP pyrophosphatase MutT (NUDIX family)